MFAKVFKPSNLSSLAFTSFFSLFTSISSAKSRIPLNTLVKKGMVMSYPPLMSQKDSVVVQFEHTVFIGSNGVNVLSKGDDY